MRNGDGHLAESVDCSLASINRIIAGHDGKIQWDFRELRDSICSQSETLVSEFRVVRRHDLAVRLAFVEDTLCSVVAQRSFGGPGEAGYMSKIGCRTRLCGLVSESSNGCEGTIASCGLGVGAVWSGLGGRWLEGDQVPERRDFYFLFFGFALGS